MFTPLQNIILVPTFELTLSEWGIDPQVAQFYDFSRFPDERAIADGCIQRTGQQRQITNRIHKALTPLLRRLFFIVGLIAGKRIVWLPFLREKVFHRELLGLSYSF